MEERLHDQADPEFRSQGKTKQDEDAVPMQHSREMLPDPDETLRYLAREAGFALDTCMAVLKREWARTSTAVKQTRDAGLRHSRKQAREDQDERGTRPEAWVHIKKVTKRKTHSLENMPLTGELILGKREYLQLVFEQRQKI